MFYFKQKTAYDMRISDWSSDVCSSDLVRLILDAARRHQHQLVDALRMRQRKTECDRAAQRIADQCVVADTDRIERLLHALDEERQRIFDIVRLVGITVADQVRQDHAIEIGRAAGRERVCKYG